jgi:hypothetical protein
MTGQPPHFLGHFLRDSVSARLQHSLVVLTLSELNGSPNCEGFLVRLAGGAELH